MGHHSFLRGILDRDYRGRKELDCILETDRSAWCGVNLEWGVRIRWAGDEEEAGAGSHST